jgi:hypothetical protein
MFYSQMRAEPFEAISLVANVSNLFRNLEPNDGVVLFHRDFPATGG